MTNPRKNFLTGIFLVCALILIVGLVLFLRPMIGDQKQTLFVRFSNINKISVGTRVLFAGKAIGEVTAIREIQNARGTQLIDELGRLYFYELTLKIDSGVHVYNTDEITLQTSGLLGEKTIAIVPKTAGKGVYPQRLTDKKPFYANSVDPIENTFECISAIGDKINHILDSVKTWTDKNGTSTIQTLSNAVKEIEIFVRTVNQDQPQIKKMLYSLSGNMQNLQYLTDRSIQFLDTLSNAQGVLGKLINDPDLSNHFCAVISKFDILMDDINHYGLLFHQKKPWQRTREQRMTAFYALNSPMSFKTFAESELDLINTALVRLFLLTERLEEEAIQSPLKTVHFKKEVSDLKQRTEEISRKLNTYQQTLLIEP